MGSALPQANEACANSVRALSYSHFARFGHHKAAIRDSIFKAIVAQLPSAHRIEEKREGGQARNKTESKELRHVLGTKVSKPVQGVD